MCPQGRFQGVVTVQGTVTDPRSQQRDAGPYSPFFSMNYTFMKLQFHVISWATFSLFFRIASSLIYLKCPKKIEWQLLPVKNVSSVKYETNTQQEPAAAYGETSLPSGTSAEITSLSTLGGQVLLGAVALRTLLLPTCKKGAAGSWHAAQLRWRQKFSSLCSLKKITFFIAIFLYPDFKN